MTPLLHAAPALTESFLGDLVQLFSAQVQGVALIGTQHQLEDVLVIRRVPLSLRTVDEALDLTGGEKTGFVLMSTSKLLKLGKKVTPQPNHGSNLKKGARWAAIKKMTRGKIKNRWRIKEPPDLSVHDKSLWKLPEKHL